MQLVPPSLLTDERRMEREGGRERERERETERERGGGSLANLRNLLDEVAQAVAVLVGEEWPKH